MRIIVDHILDSITGEKVGEMVIHTEHQTQYRHPDGTDESIGIVEALTYYAEHPELREKVGYHAVSRIGDESQPISRWERIKRQLTSNGVEDKLKEIFSNERQHEPQQPADSGPSGSD